MFEASIAAGSEYLGHPPLVVAGETTSLCFAMWRRREIKRGDVVLLETAGCIDRYHAILSRPVVVGEPTPVQQEAADALKGVLEAAVDAIKPGVEAGEVDRACRRIVEEKGSAPISRAAPPMASGSASRRTGRKAISTQFAQATRWCSSPT